MARSALKKDTLREIKKSFARFVSILCIVGLGAGFFVGVKATVPSMRYTADQYFNQYELMDMEILSTVGFGDEDIEAIRGIEEIDAVMPAYSMDALVEQENTSFVVSINSIPDPESGYEFISRPEVVEGRMPEADNECIIFRQLLHSTQEADFKIGDTITLSEMAGETEVDSVLTTRDFTVVGIMESAKYFSFSYGTSSVGNGNVAVVMYVPSAAFTYERYTEMYVTLKCHKEGVSSYSDEYAQTVSDVAVKLQDIGVVCYNDYIKEINEQIKEAEAQLNDQAQNANEQLDDAKQQLDNAATEIADAIAKLQQGWEEYNQGLLNAEEQIANYEQVIADSRKELEEGEKKLNEGQAEYDANKKKAEEEFARAEQELQNSRQKLDDGWDSYKNGLAAYEAGRSQYEAGLAAYEAGVKEYEDGLAAYEQGVKDYQAGVDQLDDAREALSAAQSLSSIMHTIINEYESTGTVRPLNYAAMLRAIDLLNSTTTGHNAITKIFEEQGLGNILVESAALVARMMVVGFDQALVEAFQANIDALDAMISDAEAALVDAEKQLEEAKKQLEEAKAKLEATPAQLEAAKKELDAAEAELVSAEAELAAAKKELDDGEEQYKAGLEKYNTEKANAQQQLDDAKKQLDDSRAALEDGKLQLADAEEQLKQAKIDADIQLTEGREELENAEEQIDDAQEEYQMGLEEYNKAVEEAESAIADGSKRIAGAKAQMTDIESGKWYVFDRNDMVVYYENYTDDTARVDAIAGIFPVFFLLVAALVCLTTMSRMVEEQRTQMGTYKALGYSKRSIASKFVVYSLIASIIGCILGQAICVQILPRVIAVAYQTMYKMPDLQLVIPWSSVILSTIAGLACTVLVALFCCMRELKITTAQLMRPKAPKAGKKILLEKIRPLWKVMNFSQKITARNLFRYKVRLCMTILGIGGCMALMVAGFGLQDAILPIADKQFNYICNYDAIIASTAEYNEEQAEHLKEQLLDDPRVSSAIVTRQMTGNTSSQNSSKAVVDVNIFVPNDPSRLTDIINTYEYKSGEILPLTDDSILITQKMAEDLKVYAGDTFTFTYNDVDYEIPVTGVVENYVYHYVYMTPATYEKIFGKAPVYNSALIITDEEALASQGGSEQFVSDWLSQNTDFLSVTFMDSAASSLDDLMGSLNTVVLILIICAGALAFIVVYNLTNINISERVREIATIKVLGFKHREVNMYVFQENIVMSVIGILFGALGGYLMAMFMIRTVEVDMAMFVRRVEWSSYLFSALLTAFFTILVNLFMSKKMKDISMVESLKAIE